MSGLGSGRLEVGLLDRGRLLHVLRLLDVLWLLKVLRLLHVLRLLGSRSGLLVVLWLLNVLRLRSGSAGVIVALEGRIVPTGIVLSILVVVVQAGSDRSGSEVAGLLGLLHVTGSSNRGGGSGVWWRSRGNGQVVAGGLESVNQSITDSC